MSDPEGEPNPIVKIMMPAAAASLAASTPLASRSSPSVISTSARLIPSPLPKAAIAIRIAEAMSVPPLGMVFVSRSSSEVSTAPLSRVSGACRKASPAKAIRPTRSPLR